MSTSPAATQYPVTTGRYAPGYISTDDLISTTLTASGNVVVGGTITATGGIEGFITGAPPAFDVRNYGAKGDGQAVADGAMTSGQNTLTCATSKPFSANDKGKAITVSQAGAAGVTTLVTTIASVVSSSQVTLAANASGTVSSCLVLWATDDTAKIQKAINDAAVALTFVGSAVVYVPQGQGLFYGIAGPLVTSAQGNGQLTLPVISDTTKNKGVLIFQGSGDGGALRHWRQLTPSLQGSTLVSMGAFASTGAQITSLNAGGQAACISGPTGANGFGTATPGDHSTGPLFNNLMPVFRNMNIFTTHTVNGIGYSALNLHGCANAGLYDFGYGTTGTAAAGDFNTPVTFANGLVVGVVMPASGNNDSSPMRNVTCHGGYTRAIYLTEHCDWQGGTVLYSWSGICPVGTYGDGGSGTGAFHGANWSMVSVEGCTYNGEMIGPGAGGVGPQVHGVIDNEGVPKWHDNTSGTSLAAALGDVKIVGGGGTVSTDNGTGVRFINDVQPAGPVAQIALTINVAAQNTYWRWATVYLAGGTVTTVQVSVLMGGASAPAMTTVYTQSSGALPLVPIRVPPGGWIQVNGTVIPTTNSWVLD